MTTRSTTMKVQRMLAVNNEVDNESGQQVRLMTTSPANGCWPSTVRLTKKAQLTLAVNNKVDKSNSS